MFCLEHQRAPRSRLAWGVTLLPAPHTPSLTKTSFSKKNSCPKIQALNSAQDLTSKTGLSLIPRPDLTASRLLIFWITHFDNCYLSKLSSLSQTELSQVSCSPSDCEPASRQKAKCEEIVI